MLSLLLFFSTYYAYSTLNPKQAWYAQFFSTLSSNKNFDRYNLTMMLNPETLEKSDLLILEDLFIAFDNNNRNTQSKPAGLMIILTGQSPQEYQKVFGAWRAKYESWCRIHSDQEVLNTYREELPLTLLTTDTLKPLMHSLLKIWSLETDQPSQSVYCDWEWIRDHYQSVKSNQLLGLYTLKNSLICSGHCGQKGREVFNISNSFITLNQSFQHLKFLKKQVLKRLNDYYEPLIIIAKRSQQDMGYEQQFYKKELAQRVEWFYQHEDKILNERLMLSTLAGNSFLMEMTLEKKFVTLNEPYFIHQNPPSLPFEGMMTARTLKTLFGDQAARSIISYILEMQDKNTTYDLNKKEWEQALEAQWNLFSKEHQDIISKTLCL